MGSEAGIQRINVGAIDAFPVGTFRAVHAAGREIHILRTADGDVFAIKNTCPHRGAPICQGKVRGTMLPSSPGCLEYALDGRVIACPWHGIEFDLRTGEALFTGYRKRLVTYPVSVEGGCVFVTVRGSEREREEAANL